MTRWLSVAIAVAAGCGGAPASSKPLDLPVVARTATDAPAPPVVAAPRDRSAELGAAVQALRRGGEPDPAAVYAVPIAGDPFEGTATAKVTLVQFTQLGGRCPYCVRVAPTIRALQEQYKDDLRVVWKHYIVHQDVATGHALAGCAAHRQGKFLAMVDKLWSITGNDWDALRRAGEEVGLDVAKLAADMDGKECMDEVVGDIALGGQLGVTGTPTFFINGRVLTGARPLEQFRPIIDEELAKANAALQRGVAAEDYYASIVSAGRTTAP
jgi:protein-disulfide isomerase